MLKIKQRPYKSLVRERQAGETRRRIVDVWRQLFFPYQRQLEFPMNDNYI